MLRRFNFPLLLLLAFAIAVPSIVPSLLHAQLTAPLPGISVPTLGSADKTMMPPTPTEGQLFSSAIDPAEYHMGPGDVLQCRFWTSDQVFYPVVSSDEELVVSHLGEFSTHGKTLAQIRDEIYSKASSNFPNFGGGKSHQEPAEHPVSISLYQPRRVYVRVEGDVANPGGVPLLASNRADVAVDLANRLSVEPSIPADPAQAQKYKNEREQHQRVEALFGKRDALAASQRYITISHSDGTMERLDLVRYAGTHDPKAAPLVREGDVIHVPFRDVTAGVIGVYGAVQAPGEFEFVNGDSLSSAIKYAFGPTAQADLEHVELTRSTQPNDPETKIYDLRAIMSGAAPDVPLMRGDRIVLRGKHENSHAAVVAVRGEVAIPGVYPIEAGETRISDVIKQAGGLLPDAYPRASRVLRHGMTGEIIAGTPEDVSRTGRLENLTVEDTGSFTRQMALRPTDVVVDLDRVLTKGDRSADIALADGDEIVISPRSTTVYVSGFVHRSGYVAYEEGAPLSYYIAQAGGYADGALKSQTTVIKAGSKAWYDPSDTKIEAGDEIYVPREPEISETSQQAYVIALASAAVSLAGFILTFYLSVLKKP